MQVPFVDLEMQHIAMSKQLVDSISRVIFSSRFCLGEEVEKFEEEFARYCGTKYCVSTSSGTAALHLALLACGVGQGDEVITVPNTYIATAEAISHTGAKPVFVDIEPGTYNMDVSRLELSDRMKAIVPVHLYGLRADTEAIAMAGLPVIEDACQGHGLRPIVGKAACFSFYPSKNLGAMGDAGAIATNDLGMYNEVRVLRNHGQVTKGQHDVIGFNYRMDELQAAILRLKLKYLDKWNEKRRWVARLYRERLSGMDLVLPSAATSHVYHLYVVRPVHRDRLVQYLNSHGVSTGIHYPIPIHLQGAYKSLGYKEGHFPVTERCCREILSLPMYPGLNEEQIEYVADQIADSGYA